VSTTGSYRRRESGGTVTVEGARARATSSGRTRLERSQLAGMQELLRVEQWIEVLSIVVDRRSEVAPAEAVGSTATHDPHREPRLRIHPYCRSSTVIRVTDANGHILQREFCPACGSPLGWKSDVFPDVLGVAAGSLDDPSGLETLADIWSSSAQPWDDLPANARQFETQPPDEELEAFLASHG
jgi:hypothetical protein